MKNCDEMVNDLFERREQYVAEQKRKRKILARAASSVCCLCLVSLMGAGAWKSGWFNAEPPVSLNDSTIIGEKDYIDPADSTSQQGSGDVSDAAPPQSGDPAFNGESGQDSLIEWQGKIISDYDVGSSACYAAPDNNNFGLSVPLRNAIAEYGDAARYMVVVDIFKDQEQVSADKSLLEAEMMRLEALGYNVILEENDLDTEPVYYLEIQASKEQLENFACNEDYGYFFFGRSERVN